MTYTGGMNDLSVIPARFRPPTVMQASRTCTMIARMCSRWSLGLMSDEEFIQYLAAAGEGLMDVATTLTMARQYWINQREAVEASVVTPDAVEALTAEAENFLGQFQPPDDLHTDNETTEGE